jgi:hypothetical protein
MDCVIIGALSLLLDELKTFQTFINGHFVHCLAFLSDDLFDFAGVLLRLFGRGGLPLIGLLFRLGLGLNISMMATLWL